MCPWSVDWLQCLVRLESPYERPDEALAGSTMKSHHHGRPSTLYVEIASLQYV